MKDEEQTGQRRADVDGWTLWIESFWDQKRGDHRKEWSLGLPEGSQGGASLIELTEEMLTSGTTLRNKAIVNNEVDLGHDFPALWDGTSATPRGLRARLLESLTDIPKAEWT